jgi:hypothetical protein
MGEQGLYCVKRCIVRPVNASPFHLLLSTYHHLYFGLEIQYNALHDRSVLRADVHTVTRRRFKQTARDSSDCHSLAALRWLFIRYKTPLL